jgi:DNA-binding MarR family transcriptional regulator
MPWVDSSRTKKVPSEARTVEVRECDTREVVDAVRRLTRALRVAAGATQAKSGVSAAQLYVLRSLMAGDGVSINELAKRTYTDRSSVAAVVERLVERGLVVRTASASDRRFAEVCLTHAGRHLAENAPVAPTAMLVSALEQLNDGELGVLAQSLNRLVGAFGLATSPARMMFDEANDR